jgi:hypothetical protein
MGLPWELQEVPADQRSAVGGKDASRTLRLHQSQGAFSGELFQHSPRPQSARQLKEENRLATAAPAAALRRSLASDQSLPEKDGVLCPPGTRPFRGHFFALGADVLETKDPKLDPPKGKRRWFQFSLRTLMFAVALLALLSEYVARQHAFVQERQRFLDDDASGWSDEEGPGISWIRHFLGDQGRSEILLDPTADKAKRQQAAALFPEAKIIAIQVGHIRHGSRDECYSKQVSFFDEPAHSDEDTVADEPEMNANSRK